MRPQERIPAYRRGGAAGRKKEQQKDPVAFVISGQIAVALLFVLFAFVLRDAQPGFWQPVREQYVQLLTRPMKSEEWGFGEGLGQWYASWRDRTLDAVSVVMRSLTQNEESVTLTQAAENPPLLQEKSSFASEKSETALPYDQTEPVSESGEEELESVSAMVAQPLETLSGAGGWFGGAPDDRKIPASCSLSPIILSHRMVAPVGGNITSLFGWREHPITGESDFHRGLDIAAPQGTRVSTPLAGVVSEVGESSIYGIFVTVDHGNGLKTTYAHCDSIEVEEGTRLRMGEMVAKVGSTGISTGPHLHFEISKDDIFYNPLWGLFSPAFWRDVRYGD